MSEANVQSTGTLLFDNTPKPMTEDHRSEGIIQELLYARRNTPCVRPLGRALFIKHSTD